MGWRQANPERDGLIALALIVVVVGAVFLLLLKFLG